jgi:hypothetical protein
LDKTDSAIGENCAAGASQTLLQAAVRAGLTEANYSPSSGYNLQFLQFFLGDAQSRP